MLIFREFIESYKNALDKLENNTIEFGRWVYLIEYFIRIKFRMTDTEICESAKKLLNVLVDVKNVKEQRLYEENRNLLATYIESKQKFPR